MLPVLLHSHWCVSGFPQPELRWYQRVKDGLRPITDDEKHVIHVLLNHGQTLSVSEFWYQLTIINVQVNKMNVGSHKLLLGPRTSGLVGSTLVWEHRGPGFNLRNMQKHCVLDDPLEWCPSVIGFYLQWQAKEA